MVYRPSPASLLACKHQCTLLPTAALALQLQSLVFAVETILSFT